MYMRVFVAWVGPVSARIDLVDEKAIPMATEVGLVKT